MIALMRGKLPPVRRATKTWLYYWAEASSKHLYVKVFVSDSLSSI